MPKGVFVRKPFSEEHRMNISLGKMGKPSWSKGKKFSEKHRRNISLSKTGKNHPMWGKHHSEKTKAKMRANNAGGPGRTPGFHMSEETKLKLRLAKLGKMAGDKHWNWKGGITPKNKIIRCSLDYKLWREAVFRRDNYTCIWCGARSAKGKKVVLHADHIKPFATYPELRLVLENGRTLCFECHKTTESFFNKSRWKNLQSA